MDNELLEFLILHKQSLNRQIEALSDFHNEKSNHIPDWEATVDTQMWTDELTINNCNLMLYCKKVCNTVIIGVTK